MLKPLEQFYCDVCGDVIEKPEDGYVIWRRAESESGVFGRECDFKIIHQGRCDNRNYPSSMHLSHFLGPDGMAYLLSFLSIGPVKIHLGQKNSPVPDLDEFVDFFRRLQMPYYEEARRRFKNENYLDLHSDGNEVGPYMLSCLEQTVTDARFKD